MIDVDELPTVLRELATRLRENVGKAAQESAGDTLCYWQADKVGGQERLVEVRKYPHGDATEVIAVPLVGGITEYLAMVHPGVGDLLADMIERAAKSIEVHLAKNRAAMTSSAMVADFTALATLMEAQNHD